MRATRRMGIWGWGCLMACFAMISVAEEPKTLTLGEVTGKLSSDSAAAYDKCPYSFLSKNYVARFHRDSGAKCKSDEVEITAAWQIRFPEQADPVVENMARHLAEFFEQMQIPVAVIKQPLPALLQSQSRTITLIPSGGGKTAVAESFTLAVEKEQITIRGMDANGVRDGVVHLVDAMGFRNAPYITIGEQTFAPRLPVRLGSVPWMGTMRDLVFMGYNATFTGGGNLHVLSTSKAIPELATRQNASGLTGIANAVKEAQRYGLKTYCWLDTRQKYKKEDPVFLAHPDLRGALTWKADGEYVLCTEHPLVQQYLAESIEGIFKAAPDLAGVVVIIGGEGFYHCFMRAYGVEKGHTNCARCEALGADTVVSNLCNRMAEAARKINPKAEVVAWPYSAQHVWSSDAVQSGFIAKLKPGTAIFTEIEKDEFVEKQDGVRKSLWDYSIDLIGPGERAKKQIEACKAAGIPLYMKSEPELGFEAPRLPHIPCLDRWWDRADALASCGASGAWVFPAFRPVYGTSAAEVSKYAWWTPGPTKEEALTRLANRIAGPKGGPALRDAWRHVSKAIEWSPEFPSYYNGPYYLGPAHPMCADPDAKLPEVFYGRYLFMCEITDADGLKLRPTFVTSPTGNVPVFGRFYRTMEQELTVAKEDAEKASKEVPPDCRAMFDAEISPIRWFYHTARTEANFYESCQLRDRIRAVLNDSAASPEARNAAKSDFVRWKEVLEDERANTREALPVVEADMRLDCYYGGDHSFSHCADMIRAKLDLMDREINVLLPELEAKLK